MRELETRVQKRVNGDEKHGVAKTQGLVSPAKKIDEKQQPKNDLRHKTVRVSYSQ